MLLGTANSRSLVLLPGEPKTSDTMKHFRRFIPEQTEALRDEKGRGKKGGRPEGEERAEPHQGFFYAIPVSTQVVGGGDWAGIGACK